MLIMADSHVHLNDARFAHDLEQVLWRSRHAGVTSWIVPGVDAASWPSIQMLPWHATLGCMPLMGCTRCSYTATSARNLDSLAQWLVSGKVIAVGENRP